MNDGSGNMWWAYSESVCACCGEPGQIQVRMGTEERDFRVVYECGAMSERSVALRDGQNEALLAIGPELEGWLVHKAATTCPYKTALETKARPFKTTRPTVFAQ